MPAAAHAGWTKSASVAPGEYADAEVFRLADGRYRMLYGTESQVSADTGADVVSLPGGGYRMYINGPDGQPAEPGMPPVVGVVSLTSADGATWQPEAGLRLPHSWLAGPDRFGFTSTTRLADGTWLMAYEVDRDGRYAPDVPTGLAHIQWATSTDGLTFVKQGVAVNPNKSLLLGGARSPEFFGNQMYFHSLKGIYRVTWTGTGFTRRAKLEYGACKDPGKVFPWTPPPADPTLARIGRATVMFHGDHKRGIFRTTARAGAKACFKGIFGFKP